MSDGERNRVADVEPGGWSQVTDYPGRWQGPAARRAFWARRLGMSATQVTWLPELPRFRRLLDRMAPRWQRGEDVAGAHLARDFRLGGGEALVVYNLVRALLPLVASPSRATVTVHTDGMLSVRLCDEEAGGVTVDDGWTARIVDRAVSQRRRLRSRGRRWWRRLRWWLGLGPPRLSAERLEEGLVARRGWLPMGPDRGRMGVVQAYYLPAPEAAIAFSNLAAALLGCLWEEVEGQVTLEGSGVAVTLFAGSRGWPPADLFDAADQTDDLAQRFGARILDLAPAAEAERATG